MQSEAEGTPWIPAAGWEFKRLRFGGRCRLCGRDISKNENGWHNPNAEPKVVCSHCSPAEAADRTSEQLGKQRASVVGGSSTLRDSAAKSRPKPWRKGAAGEYILYEALTRELTRGERILTSLCLPNRPADIDCVVVAPSGVWVLDAKYWKGTVRYGARGGSLDVGPLRLFVDGVDRTTQLIKIYDAVIPVAEIIGDPSVPLHRAVAFVYADWAPVHMLRILRGKKPFRHDGVWFGPPRTICREIEKPGPLSSDRIEDLALRIETSLGHR
jgi:hypothetical protein